MALPRKKKIAVITVLFIVAFAAWTSFSNATKEPPYKLAEATNSNIEEVVSESGKILSNNRTDIYSPTNGNITKIYVQNGDVVSEGDKLFDVESSATEQEQRAAQSNYLAAVSALNSARSTEHLLQSAMFDSWQTFKDLSTSDAYENNDGSPRYDQRSASQFHIAEKDWLAAQAKYKDQQTAIAQAQAQVNSTNLLYQATKDAVVKATTNGVVQNTSISVGSGVKINQVASSVTPVMTLVGFAPVEVSILLGESDIVKVEPGQEVALDITAIKDKTYKGIVTRVDKVGTEEAGVVRFAVYVDVENPDDKIKPGMSVDVDIKTKSLKNVLTVPSSSVKPYEGGRAVRVVDPKTKEIKYIPVKIGIRGQSKTQIISGIEEGQEVVVSLSNENLKRPSLF